MKINGDTPEDGATPETLLLRRMNHREWLVQFSETLLAQYRRPDGTTNPMTPFRAGVISRLKQAARYIALLEGDLKQALEANRLLSKQIREHQQLDRDLDRHQEDT